MDSKHKSPRDYESKRQLAERVNVSERTVNYWLLEGLPHFRMGTKLLRFKTTEVDAWLEKKFRCDTSAVDRIVDEVLG